MRVQYQQYRDGFQVGQIKCHDQWCRTPHSNPKVLALFHICCRCYGECHFEHEEELFPWNGVIYMPIAVAHADYDLRRVLKGGLRQLFLTLWTRTKDLIQVGNFGIVLALDVTSSVVVLQ